MKNTSEQSLKQSDSTSDSTHPDHSYYHLLQNEVQNRLATLPQDGPANENDLWRSLAGQQSSDWLEARTALDDAEKQLNRLLSPDMVPLGLIGTALDSQFINTAEETYNRALARFVIVDEELRLNEAVQSQYQTLLDDLQARLSTIEELTLLNRHLGDITSRLGFLEKSTLTEAAQNVVSLPMRQFADHARRIIRENQKATAAYTKNRKSKRRVLFNRLVRGIVKAAGYVTPRNSHLSASRP